MRDASRKILPEKFFQKNSSRKILPEKFFQENRCRKFLPENFTIQHSIHIQNDVQIRNNYPVFTFVYFFAFFHCVGTSILRENRLPVVATKTERCFFDFLQPKTPSPVQIPKIPHTKIGTRKLNAVQNAYEMCLHVRSGFERGKGFSHVKQRSVFVATTGNRFLIFLRGGLSPFSSK